MWMTKNDDGDGGGGCADDDSVIWLFYFYFVCLFVCLFFDQCPRRKASLIIGIFLVFFSSLLSTRITSGTGCSRNMAGSWGKALAKLCRVRTHSSVHLCWMYAGGTEPLPSVIFFPLTFPGFFFYISKFSFLFTFFRWSLPLCVLLGEMDFYINKHNSSCSCSLKREEYVPEALESMRAGILGVGRRKWSVYLSSVLHLVNSNTD